MGHLQLPNDWWGKLKGWWGKCSIPTTSHRFILFYRCRKPSKLFESLGLVAASI